MLAFIYAVVIWLIVPLIIFSLLMLALVIISSTELDENNKISAVAGLGTGLILFIIYVVILLQIPNSTNFNIKYAPVFDVSALLPLSIGFVIGFCLLWLLSAFLPKRIIGIITLLLAATSSSALFSYYFTRDYKDMVLFAALGTVLG